MIIDLYPSLVYRRSADDDVDESTRLDWWLDMYRV